MSSTITRPGTSGGGIGIDAGSRGWGGDGDRSPRRPPASPGRLGMAFGLAGIGMLFIAMTSAYVVRHGLDPGWRSIQMPRVLAMNTAVLLASSFTLELARRTRILQWLGLTLALGLLFVAGQIVAWRELAAAGVFLSTTPHASFFYLLTALHGAHVLGGIGALTYVFGSARAAGVLPLRPLEVTALYWHFMDALWVYLVGLLFVWR